MAHESADNAAARERLSALADGELGADDVARACAAWRDDEPARAAWHAYQLIGDVLRSDDLASRPAGDAAFLAALRVRLAAEPIVFAPQPLETPQADVHVAPLVAAGGGTRARRWSWMGTSAVAAGFVAVAGVLVLTRSPGVAPQPEVRGNAPSLAQVSPVAAPAQAVVVQASTAAQPAEPPALVASGKLIRDARLDRYLAAHKQFAGTSALGVPSGFLRSATAVEADR